MKRSFEIVGIRPLETEEGEAKARRSARLPWVAVVTLAVILLGCTFAPLLTAQDPAYIDLARYDQPPGPEHVFGTDPLGRDIFACIWHGGRISVFIGTAAALLSAFLAATYGTMSAFAPDWLDAVLMRLTEIVHSIPSLLLVILLLACLDKPNVFSIALVIGLTSWPPIAKVVRTEVKQIAGSDFLVAARTMGGGFFYILRTHLLPNFFPSIMFMVVMNVRSAIVYESTLSFMGLGLPLSVISWGSMLSLSEKALMTDAWWIILIPGAFLVAFLLALTAVGNCLRREANQKKSHL